MNDKTCLETDVETDDVLTHFNKIDKADLDNITPTVLPVTADQPLRDDTEEQPLDRKDALHGETEDNYFVGPKPR